ncbi:MAG: DUF47 family protein [Sedimentisphaerales bacterium]|nr:DUF47 family protein [Sedimentisphaerales bacterium]
MFFISKQKQIELELSRYYEKVNACLTAFHDGIRQYCQKPDQDRLRENFQAVHKHESRADDLRREIEVIMYSKSVFPESRGDILSLLEAVDKVPNTTEWVMNMILTHNIIIPETLSSDILELVEVCYLCVRALLDSAEKLFTDFTNATVAIGRVDELETEADHLEFRLYEQIFKKEPSLDPMHKILLRELVRNIAAISDRAENAGDLIRIIVAKRKT